MKHLFMLTLFVVIALQWIGCKKCYQCHDTCQQCVLLDSGHVVSTHVICTDSFSSLPAFNAAVSADSAMGYICSATGSTYNKNFCVNKPGDETYLNYYNQNGTAICTSK